MPNTYFQFKQFRVEQGNCAMKVCTDSCLFGAYIDVQQAAHILDIGAGTGLLSLMAAQQSDAVIDAVEINPEAATQARENFCNSKWSNRLNLYPSSLQEFAKSNTQIYDVILSNPPFFLASLKSGVAAKDTAKHTGELLFEDILGFAKDHLAANGKLYLLLPPREANHFAELAKTYNLYLNETLAVYTYKDGQCIRHIQTYSFSPVSAPKLKAIDIRQADKVTYTTEFSSLLKEYYLIF
jgi:tRNA1Val (adenine37-N6)-methyltransferase